MTVGGEKKKKKTPKNIRPPSQWPGARNKGITRPGIVLRWMLGGGGAGRIVRRAGGGAEVDGSSTQRALLICRVTQSPQESAVFYHPGVIMHLASSPRHPCTQHLTWKVIKKRNNNHNNNRFPQHVSTHTHTLTCAHTHTQTVHSNVHSSPVNSTNGCLFLLQCDFKFKLNLVEIFHWCKFKGVLCHWWRCRVTEC